MRLCDTNNGKRPGYCYPDRYYCDGHADCSDKTDEPSTCETECTDAEFKCETGRCLPRGFICDGQPDCGMLPNGDADLSDEAQELCKHPVICNHNEYLCERGNECVHLSKFCDGRADCQDGSDEHMMCKVQDKKAEDCEYASAMTIHGLRCYCPNNKFFGDNNKCQYINYCDRNGQPPVCSQGCQDNKNGTVVCSCFDTRQQLVNKTCLSNPTAKFRNIAIMHANNYYLINEETGFQKLSSIPSNYHKINAVFAFANDMVGYERYERAEIPILCFLEFSTLVADQISCALMAQKDGTTKMSFSISIDLEAITIFRYDPIGNNWILSNGKNYMTICKHDIKRITKCKSYGVSELADIVDIAYDPISGYIFYSDVDLSEIGIWRLDLATGTKIRLTDKTAQSPTIAIDPFTRNVFFADVSSNFIRSIDYDGKKHARIVISGHLARNVNRLAYSEGKLFINLNNNRLFMYDAFGKTDQVGVQINTTFDYTKSNIMNMISYRKNENDWKWNGEKVCKNAGCEDICVGNWENKTTCLCQDGLLANGNKCVRLEQVESEKRTIAVMAQMRPSSVKVMGLTDKGIESIGISTVQSIKRPSAMTVDMKNRRVIMYDLKTNQLIVKDIGKNTEKSTKMEGVWNCEGMVYDHNSDNLYMTDQARKTVTVTRLSNLKLRKTLITGNMTNPRSIAIHIPKSYLFWGSWSESGNDGLPAKIERSKLDGTQRKTLVSRNTMWLNGMTVDTENDYLYWADAYYNVIERIRINGADREIIIEDIERVNHPYGLSFFDGYIYWSEFKSGRIRKASVDGKDRNTTVTLYDYPTSNIFEFALIPDNTYKLPTSACSSNKCDEFCFASSCKGSVGCEPVTCGCDDGKYTDKGRCVVNSSYVDPDRCDERTHFQCKVSKKCIEIKDLCDGEDDCGDGSDEDKMTTCKSYRCAEDKHKCDGTLCLPMSWLCDGSNDCDDGTDEDLKVCKSRRKRCELNKFQCDNYNCISKERRCDGAIDCANGEDERGCFSPKICEPQEFRCGNGKCIEQYMVCDGVPNCSDGLDEAHCDDKCIIGRQFRCKTGSACLDLLYRCDGVADCPDGSDETDVNCKSTADYCGKGNQFMCQDGKCIRQSAICDGFPDCSTGEDETECPAEMCDPTKQFVCDGGQKCISKELECDGVDDCGNNSDESHCEGVRVETAKSRCQPPMYQCKSTEKFTCLSDKLVCDGNEDCPDGDDEQEWCATPCDPNDNHCSHTCRNTPSGPVCSCPDKYYLEKDGRTCSKKDPCRFGQCSQLCEPHGSVNYCYCHSGFKLQPDRFTCLSDDPTPPFLIYSNRHELRLLHSKHPGSTPMISELSNAIAIDFKYFTNGSILLYWTDLQADKIFRGLLDDRAIIYKTVIVSYGVYNPEGMAVDWITGNIYWIDSHLDTIQVVTEDGSKRATVVSGKMANLRSLALDPEEGLMFWTDWEEKKPRIERATLAGTDRKILFNVLTVRGTGWPNGIVCDTSIKRIYWVDAKSDSIHTTTYDGLDHREVIRNPGQLGHPFGLDIFENYLYFTDWKSSSISRINKFNGSEFQVVEKSVKQPFSVKIVHRSKQNQQLKNPCIGMECDGLCLIENKNKAKCICTNLQVQKGEKGCEALEDVLLIITNNTIRGYPIQPESASRFSHNGTQAFPLVYGKQYDLMRSVTNYGTQLRILDTVELHITTVNLTGLSDEDVIMNGNDLQGATGMAMDVLIGSTYISVINGGIGRIDVLSADGTSRRTLVDNLKLPRDVMFVDQIGKVVWFDDSTTPSKIYSMYGDGTGMTRSETTSQLMSKSFNPVVDQKNMQIYWVTAGKLAVYDMKTEKVEELVVEPEWNDTALSVAVIDKDTLVISEVDGSATDIVMLVREDNKWRRAEIPIKVPLAKKEKHQLKVISMRERKPNDMCSKCTSLCLRGASPTVPICQCSQGSNLIDGKCQPSGKRVFFVTSDGDLNSVEMITNDKGIETQKLRAHILHPDVANQRIYRIAVDAKRDLVYAVTRFDQVWQCATNGSFAKQIFTTPSHRIASITIDRVTGYVLLSARMETSTTGVIIIINPFVEDMYSIVLADNAKVPHDVVVDPPKGKLFWASFDCIKSANYDGTDLKCIIYKNASTIAIDEVKSRLCYIDSDKSAVDCVDYDGTNEEKNVVTFQAQGIGEMANMMINGDELYYFDKNNQSGSIVRAKRGKNGLFVVVDSVLKNTPKQRLRLFDMDIMDVDNSILYTACSNNNGGCEHLCITSDDSTRTIRKKCICVHSLLDDNGHCVPSRTFIAYTKAKSIEFVSPDIIHLSPPLPRITTDDCFMARPFAISSDSMRHRLYYGDSEKYRITSINFDGTGCFVVAEDLGVVPSMVYDEVHQDMYYIRSVPQSIWRINMAENDADKYPTTASTVLTLTVRDRPRNIVLHPCRMIIFFSNNAETGSTIERVYYSGYKREMVIQEDLYDVRGLAIDLDAEKLYFSDGRDFRVSRCDYDGTHREVLISQATQRTIHPFELAINDDQLIFTDHIRKSVKSVDKLTGAGEKLLHFSTDVPYTIAVIDQDREYCTADACHNNPLNCSDYCRLTPDGRPVCACNGERRLNKDNITCDGDSFDKKCAENEFKCMGTDMCIPYEETCDGYNDCPIHDDEDVIYCSTRTCRPGYFGCGNGLCISETKLCNRVNDCANYADEMNCTCSDSDFKCNSGLCVPKAARCDRAQDCNDWSDEIGCPFKSCALEEFGMKNLINCATTSQCILPSWKCDGHEDCFDGWDEKDCFVEFNTPNKSVSPPKICDKDTHFACVATRTCMPIHWQCDGQPDCADGSDEKGCAPKCNDKYEFTCTSSNQCIPSDDRCDGKNDCPNGEDEKGCEYHECEGNNTFRCTNHRCIPMLWRCDGTDDCLDNAKSMGSDELDCGSGRTSFNLPSHCTNETCEVACELTALICNGIKDCANGFDEENCASLDRECGIDEWMCNNGQCIPKERLCDATVECVDGSDEWIEYCSLSDGPRRGCKNGWFCLLRNGTVGCLEEEQLCDGIKDCLNGQDERCDQPPGKCPLAHSECDQPWNCRRHAGFETCGCDPGFHLSPYDQSTCLHTSPCSRANCSHQCVDKRTGHECVCAAGYTLAENERDCRRNDSIEAEIVLVYGHRLKLFTLDGHSKATLLMNMTNGVSVDYDVKSDLLYWTDVTRHGYTAGIISMSNQPNSYRILPSLPSKGVDGIALDWLGRNIYYTNRNQNSISVCDMRGRFHRALLKGAPLMDPRAIVLDPLHSLLFWTDWGSSPHIGRMNMNGSDIRVLIQDKTILWPNALAVDSPANRLYYGDAHRDYIGYCNYDGSRRRIVLRNVVRHIFSISIFEDYIYWTDWHNRTLERAHKITGENKKVLISDRLYRPMGFKIIHPGLQSIGSAKTAKHPCQQPHRCDNLCIPTDSKEEFSCMCAQGFRSEGRSCVSECKPLDMVCTGTYKCIASWWRCDGQDDCGDGEDEGYFKPNACPPFPCDAGQFLCKSSQYHNGTTCLYSSKLCDGVKDCALGEDEEKEFCQQYECDDSHFKCADQKKCIPVTSVCDDRADCDDGSDEHDCEIKSCGPDFFACRDPTNNTITRCIPEEFYCDGDAECPLGQDEPPNCSTGNCTRLQFRCSNGKCIPKSRRCNGENDCGDKSDEQNCAKSSCQFKCDNKCMDMRMICDGKVDCEDGSDESEEKCVQKRMIEKGPNDCHRSEARCDGIADCKDGIDEKGCEKNQCDLSATANQSMICDGKPDCFNGLDEFQCTDTHKIYSNNLFQCSHQSIREQQVCDGKWDCADGYDESATMCQTRQARCYRVGYCDDHKQCFDVVNGMCDGIRDCRDGSDELDVHCGEMCKGRYRCTNGRCIEMGQRCNGRDDCGDGSDEDYCGASCEHYGKCSQSCYVNQFKQIKCDCAYGYFKVDNECESFSNFTELLILNGKTVHWMALPSSYEGSTEGNLNRIADIKLDILPGSIDYRYKEGMTDMLYSVGGEYGMEMKNVKLVDEKLKKSTRGKRSKTDDKSSGSLIVYDHMHDNVYFTDGADKTKVLFKPQVNIYVARAANLNSRVMIINSTGIITSMTVVPHENLIFWSTISPVPRILVAHLDGTPLETSFKRLQPHKVLIERNIFEPKSLIADIPNKRIYWIDTLKRTIETISLTGMDRRTVRKFELDDSPVSMDILAEYLYIITKSGSIRKMHKFTGATEVYNQKVVNFPPTVTIKIANEVKHIVPRGAEAKCDACPSDVVCISSGKTQKCLCGFGRVFESSTRKCVTQKEFDSEASQCGTSDTTTVYCYNGAFCNKNTATCTCPPGFYGKQCETSLCTERCWNGESCGIKQQGNIHKIDCKCASNYTNTECATQVCDGLCGPRGMCKLMSCPRSVKSCRPQTYCECDEGWEGPQCKHRSGADICSNHCFNGGRCIGNSPSSLECQCPQGYTGARCQDCGRNTKCLNGGVCSKGTNGTKDVCICPNGFKGLQCEEYLCKDACPYGHKCLYNPRNPSNPISCQCTPNAASHNSGCEPMCASTPNWCKNDGICIDYPGAPGQCHCPQKFKGPRCEEYISCEEYCRPNGFCKSMNETGYECKCQQGFAGNQCERLQACNSCDNGATCIPSETKPGDFTCVCPKGLGGERCEKVVAESCDDMECANFGFCSTQLATSHRKPSCICPPGFGGLTCLSASCDGYCHHDGTCYMDKFDTPKCRCDQAFYGSRCEYRLRRSKRPEQSSMVTTTILASLILLVLVAAGFVAYKNKQRFTVFRQFRHTIMQNIGSSSQENLNNLNPAYIAGDEGGIEMVTSNTSLVSNHDRSFNNPVYEQEMVPIYNDTVENAELLPTDNQ